MLLFSLQSEFSLYWIPVCILVGILYALSLYFLGKRKNELSKLINSILFALRTFVVAFLCFYLLNPLLKTESSETEKPTIIIAQDNSQSTINAFDSSIVKTKLQEEIKQLNKDLSDRFIVKNILFDSKTYNSDTINYKGKESDYGILMNDIENNYTNRNLGAVIVIGDGIFNKGLSPINYLNKIKTPIYTVAIGDTNIVRDLLIKKVEHNQVSYLGNKFPVDITVDAYKLKGKSANLSISKDGKVISTQTVNINSEAQTQTLSFILDAEKPGVQRYLASITILAEEKIKTNNAQSFIVDVIDSREKILILANAPHPDIAAIKESIETNQNYEVENKLLGDFNASTKPYSLVILHQINLSNGQGANILNELKTNATSYLLVTTQSNDKFNGVSISGPSNKFTDSESEFAKGFSLFSISDELRNYFKNFPALKTNLGNFSVTNSVNVLCNQRIGVVETDNPVIAFTTNNTQKVAYIFGEGIWKWRMREYADHQNQNLFNELIHKTVQYLSVKADKSFFRVYTKKIVNENDAVEFNAEVYNNSYELISEPEVSMVITNQEGKKYEYVFSKTNTSYKLLAGQFPPGDYNYIARTKIADKPYEVKGSFTVKELMAEKMNTVANHQMLYQLANKSGGKMLYANQMNQLKGLIANSDQIKPIIYTEKKLNDFIDIKWFFFLLLAFLSTEWFLRKRNGLY